MVFYLDVNEDILVKRLLSRGRTDDNEDTIRTRLNIYKETTEPLIDFYKEKKILKYINGDRELKVISDEIKQKMAT